MKTTNTTMIITENMIAPEKSVELNTEGLKESSSISEQIKIAKSKNDFLAMFQAIETKKQLINDKRYIRPGNCLKELKRLDKLSISVNNNSCNIIGLHRLFDNRLQKTQFSQIVDLTSSVSEFNKIDSEIKSISFDIVNKDNQSLLNGFDITVNELTSKQVKAINERIKKNKTWSINFDLSFKAFKFSKAFFVKILIKH